MTVRQLLYQHDIPENHLSGSVDTVLREEKYKMPDHNLAWLKKTFVVFPRPFPAAHRPKAVLAFFLSFQKSAEPGLLAITGQAGASGL